jgi:hypothetical protein
LHVNRDNADGDLLGVLGLELESQVLVRVRSAEKNFCVTEGDVKKDRGTMATADVVRKFLLSVEKLQSDVMVLLPVRGIV